MDEQKATETDQQKKQRKAIELFINPKVRGIFYNDNNRWFLDRRQYYVAKKIIKYLGENGSSKKTDILENVVKDFNNEIEKILEKFDRSANKIRQSEFFYILKKEKKSQEYKIVKLSISTCRYILQNLCPLLIRCHEKRTKGMHSTMIYELNSKGQIVYRKILEYEENENK